MLIDPDRQHVGMRRRAWIFATIACTALLGFSRPVPRTGSAARHPRYRLIACGRVHAHPERRHGGRSRCGSQGCSGIQGWQSHAAVQP